MKKKRKKKNQKKTKKRKKIKRIKNQKKTKKEKKVIHLIENIIIFNYVYLVEYFNLKHYKLCIFIYILYLLVHNSNNHIKIKNS